MSGATVTLTALFPFTLPSWATDELGWGLGVEGAPRMVGDVKA
jgi:hypothetical protein